MIKQINVQYLESIQFRKVLSDIALITLLPPILQANGTKH